MPIPVLPLPSRERREVLYVLSSKVLADIAPVVNEVIVARSDAGRQPRVYAREGGGW